MEHCAATTRILFMSLNNFPSAEYAMRILSLSTLLAFATGCPAVDLSCPEAITETPTVHEAPKPWVFQGDQGLRPLDQVAVYFGHPNQRGAQIPNKHLKSKSEEIVVWQISATNGEQYWVGCSYLGTTAALISPIESITRDCTARYSVLPTGKRLKLLSFTCR